MKTFKLVELTSEENNKPIFDHIDRKFEELKKQFQPKQPTEYVTRQYVADMLHCDLSTVHNLTVKGILKKYGCGGRVLYKRKEVEEAIIEL